MTNKSMGRTQMNECPHKTVSRFYDSAEVSLWRCDWCGQEFRAVDVGASKTVEISENDALGPQTSGGSIDGENVPTGLPRKRRAFNAS